MNVPIQFILDSLPKESGQDFQWYLKDGFVLMTTRKLVKDCEGVFLEQSMILSSTEVSLTSRAFSRSAEQCIESACNSNNRSGSFPVASVRSACYTLQRYSIQNTRNDVENFCGTSRARKTMWTM